jgi:hypothetical protein
MCEVIFECGCEFTRLDGAARAIAVGVPQRFGDSERASRETAAVVQE